MEHKMEQLNNCGGSDGSLGEAAIEIAADYVKQISEFIGCTTGVECAILAAALGFLSDKCAELADSVLGNPEDGSISNADAIKVMKHLISKRVSVTSTRIDKAGILREMRGEDGQE